MKYTLQELEQLELVERVTVINQLLEGSSLRKLLSNSVGVSKGKLKQLLKPYEYNVESQQFELLEITKISDKESDNELRDESQDNSVIELLINIKSLLQESVSYQQANNNFMLELVTNKVTNIKCDEVNLYKATKDDELITRSFKIYDSINERLKLATRSSDLNQQQLFNALMDKALRELGF